MVTAVATARGRGVVIRISHARNKLLDDAVENVGGGVPDVEVADNSSLKCIEEPEMDVRREGRRDGSDSFRFV